MKEKMERINEKINIILEYIIATFIILNTASVYAHLSDVSLRLNVLLIIFLIIYFIKVFIWKKNIKDIVSYFMNVIKKYKKIICLYLIYMLVFILFNNIKEKSFITMFVIFFPICTYIYISNKNKGNEILKKINNIIVIVATISIILYLLVSIFNIFKPTGSLEITWGNNKTIKSFFNIYFETQTFNGFGFKIQRNTGMFTEAPMYSLILCIALAIEKFILKRNKWFINLILVVTIITTFSTTGIIVLSLIYILKAINLFMQKGALSKKMKIAMTVLIIFLLVISAIYFIQRITTESGSIRIDDYIASYKAWINSPIIGNGYLNTECIEKYMSEFRSHNMGLSNSFMVLLAQCGIYLFILYVFPFIYIIIDSIKKRKYDILCFELIILVLFVTTIFMYKPILINILALAYSYIINNKEETECRKKV